MRREERRGEDERERERAGERERGEDWSRESDEMRAREWDLEEREMTRERWDLQECVGRSPAHAHARPRWGELQNFANTSLSLSASPPWSSSFFACKSCFSKTSQTGFLCYDWEFSEKLAGWPSGKHALLDEWIDLCFDQWVSAGFCFRIPILHWASHCNPIQCQLFLRVQD